MSGAIKPALTIVFAAVILTTIVFGFIYIRLLLSPIYANLSNAADIPYVSWADVASGRLNSSLMLKRMAGLLPEFPNNVDTFSSFRQIDQRFYNTYKWGYLGLYYTDIETERFANDQAPYRFIAYYKTKIESQTYYLLIEEWMNKDDTLIFLPIIVSESSFIKGGQVDTYYKVLTDINGPYFPSLVVKIESLDTCVSLKGAAPSFCMWFMKNKKNYDHLYDTLIKSDSIPNSAGKYPFLVTASPRSLPK